MAKTQAAKAKKKATYEPGAGKTKKLSVRKTPQSELPESRRGVKKALLAYSGGLDTSIMIPWLIENYGCDVVAFSANLGLAGDAAALKQKARNTGALKCVVRDLRQEFTEDFIIPALLANALYEGRYPMHTSLGRPLIARHMVEIALAEGADAVVHGCTGKGNDQCRFEFTFMALAPQLRVIAPLREWEMTCRDDEFEYAEARGISLPVSREKPYSIDKNLYGCAIECGELEDPWNEPPADAYQDTVDPVKAPDKPEDVVIGFKAGRPVSVNGKRKAPFALIEELNDIGFRHGIGRIDMVENRLVGIKSREIYEAAAATMLIAAHRDLESLTLDKATLRFKQSVDARFAELIYDGMWFSPLRESLSEFLNKTNGPVTGEVRLRLYKGSCQVVARRSPNSLYDRKLSTYEADDEFEHAQAEGFIRIHGLPLAVEANRRKRGIK